MDHPDDRWPALPYEAWKDTAQTLHRWTQMVGKVRLAQEPWLNHGWHVPLYVTARGIGTSVIHGSGPPFEIDFDFLGHRLVIGSSGGGQASFPLEPMTTAEFHRRLVASLTELGIDPRFHGSPNEVPDPIPFARDETHSSYDAAAAQRWWRALLAIDKVFKRFRTGFLGKSSQVHLFWGSFDLAVTRFSGRKAPPHPGGVPNLPDAVAREAYDHEVSSAGFWPGDPSRPEPAFYSYAYPAPDGFAEAAVEPAAATFSTTLGEWLLPYEAVRTSPDPDATLMAFLEATFAAAATLGAWDRSLECAPGEAGVPRRAVPDS